MKDDATQTWTSSRVVAVEPKLFPAVMLLLLLWMTGGSVDEAVEFVLLAISWAAWFPCLGQVGEIPVRMSAGVELFELAANRGSWTDY